MDPDGHRLRSVPCIYGTRRDGDIRDGGRCDIRVAIGDVDAGGPTAIAQEKEPLLVGLKLTVTTSESPGGITADPPPMGIANSAHGDTTSTWRSAEPTLWIVSVWLKESR